jgi:hypothetical protein
MQAQLEHFLYGPSPGGIKVRACSAGLNAKQYEALCFDYFPTDERFIGQVGSQDRECRVIADIPRQDAVYFTRIFRRENLDEAGRPGLLNHTLLVPKALLRGGLTYADLDAGMAQLDKAPRTPLGAVPPLDVAYGERTAEQEMAPIRQLMSEKALNDLIDFYGRTPQMRMCITLQGVEKERRALGYALSRLIDLESGMVPVSMSSAAIMGKYMEGTLCNLMIISVEIMIKSNIGWARMLANAKDNTGGLKVDDASRSRAQELKRKLFSE